MKPYSYSPYDQTTRELLPHIKRAFVLNCIIHKKHILAKKLHHDGIDYTLILTDSLVNAIEASRNDTIKARVSFQHHTDEAIAIVNTTTIGN